MLARKKTLKQSWQQTLIILFLTQLEYAVHSSYTMHNCKRSDHGELHNHQQFSLWFSNRSLVAPRRRGCMLVESSCSLLVGEGERNQAELVVVWGTRPAHRHTQPGCREQDILVLLQTHTVTAPLWVNETYPTLCFAFFRFQCRAKLTKTKMQIPTSKFNPNWAE